MKRFLVVIACSLFLAGCSESPKPLDSGIAVSGMVWKHSRVAAVSENSGAPIPQDSKVDVYESLIIIRHADGTRQVVPLDHVTDLKIR